MTNKEKYRQAFSVLHASEHISLEEIRMKNEKRLHRKPVMAAALCAALLIGCMGSAYAADLYGLRTKLSAWIHGEQKEVYVTGQDGSYEFTWQEDGEIKTSGGGGVEIGDDGAERPLTAQEVLNESGTDVVEKNGRTMLYDGEYSFDLTEHFDEENICRITVQEDGKTWYFEIRPNGGGGYQLSKTDKPEGAPKEAFTLVE